MELRTTEAEVQSLSEFYQRHEARLRNSSSHSASEVWPLLQEFQMRMLQLQPRISAFSVRAQQVDPITQQSRYGPQTLQRVQAMIQCYNALYEDAYQSMIQSNRFAQVQEAAEWEQKEEEERRAIEEEAAAAQRAQKEEEERRHQEEANLLSLEPSTIRPSLHIPHRDAQDAAEERRRRQDREWLQSIPHRQSMRGVQEQFRRWLDAVPAAQRSVSLRALHTVFAQICQHPEEAAFRRIRRDHAQFQQDIGQYPGGCELLIAAGFQLGTIDRVPCFLSVEPNVEVDFDGWSSWFDLLKGTLELVEQEMNRRR